jgi:limonene-1,2-epoxide hydrolase
MEENKELVREFIEAMAADDKAHVLRLMSDDCEWVVVPWGYSANGHEEVEAFLGVANKTRTYKEQGQKIDINKAFTDGENLCVEITNIASLSFLPSLKASQPICLVLHMRDRKFDSVHEYFSAPFPVSLIIRLVPLVTRIRLSARRRSKR